MYHNYLFASCFIAFTAMAEIPPINLPSINDPEGAIERLEYFIDADPGFGEGTEIPFETDPNGSVLTTFQPEVGILPFGSHLLSVRALNLRGEWSLIYRHPFFVTHMKVRTPATEITAGEFFVNDDPGIGNGIPMLLNGSSLSISPDDLLKLIETQRGHHLMGFRVMDDLGQWSSTQKQGFFRSPDFPVTSVNWSLMEGDTILDNGTELVDPPAETLTQVIGANLIGETELLNRTFKFRANLVLVEKIQTEPVEIEFQILEVINYEPVDSDGDGLLDEVETNTGVFVSLEDTGTDPNRSDTDGDGIPDGVEAGSPIDPTVDDTLLIRFFADRTRNLALGSPVLQRDENGDFLIRFGIHESGDLEEWVRLQLPEGSAQIDIGDILIRIPSVESDTVFYQLNAGEN